MNLSDGQKDVMAATGHLLVTGGPGSGKTTVSILKAADIAEHELGPEQRVLFLSFARATVSRVEEAIERERQIPVNLRRRIDVETYHSFFWRLIKSHGYLVGLPRRLSILTPPSEAIALSGIRNAYAAASKLTPAQKVDKHTEEGDERLRLMREEGRVCFDLFAPIAGDIIHGSARIRKLIALMYPAIILDEFQDTNGEQWRVVQALGEHCRLIALADPEQRIYDFIGADPERLDHFQKAFHPTVVDLSGDNHRSAGTDIAMYANDVLTGKFRQSAYSGIVCTRYEANAHQAITQLVTTTYAARTRLLQAGHKDWTLAILVPTKKMTRHVADAFREPPAGMTPIPHVASVELEGAILAADVIACLMQPDDDGLQFERLLELIRNYFHGRGGDAPTKNDLKEAAGILKAEAEWVERRAKGVEVRRNSILVAIRDVHEGARKLKLTGDPDADWRTVRSFLEVGSCSRLSGLALEARNLRVLDRKSVLRQELSQDWKDNGSYRNALAIVKRAFLREYFATSAKPENGVVVMNMHKAKGKQFDEVIIFEGWPKIAGGAIVANTDRIVRFNSLNQADDQARQNLRVSITRGKSRTTILTPKNDPCVLLGPF